MNDLNTLKFTLKEKEETLMNIALNSFILNPEIAELSEEIIKLRDEIKKLEEQNNGD